MTRSVRRRLTAASLAAAAALTVAACGTPQAGAAAVVGDRRISISQVQSAYRDVNVLTGADARLSQTDILNWLILRPYVISAAQREKVGVSVNDARLQFAEVKSRLPDPSQSALDVVQTAVALSRLQGGEVPQADVDAVFRGIVSQLQKEKVQINPRYGEGYDFSRLVVRAGEANWLKPSATPVPDANPTPGADGSTGGDGSTGEPVPTP